MKTLIVLVGCMALGAAARTGAAQQGGRRSEVNTPDIRAECARARSSVESKPVSNLDSAGLVALRVVGRCIESAGAILPGLWQNYGGARPDARILSSLIGASSDTRDGRTAATLLTIASDRAAPPVMRQAAIVVLAAYIKPYLRGSAERSPVPGEALAVDYAYMTDTGVADGTTPTDPGLKDQLARLLDAIATEKANLSLTRLARALRGEVGSAP